jgi:hypothetical protein
MCVWYWQWLEKIFMNPRGVVANVMPESNPLELCFVTPVISRKSSV